MPSKLPVIRPKKLILLSKKVVFFLHNVTIQKCRQFCISWVGDSFFYSNEGDEPIHIHCRKAEKECKFWLDTDNFDVDEAYSYNLSSNDKRQVKKIIFEYFEHIEEEWNRFQKER